MPTISEKDVDFDFLPAWEVTQYDEVGGFYRQTVIRYVQNIRGMDIVCRPSGDARVVFIEAKDYRKEPDAKQTLNAVLQESVLRKTLSTMAGLFIAERVDNDGLRPMAILKKATPIEVVLFIVEKPTPGLSAHSPTAFKLRYANRVAGRNDLEQKLTAILAQWGVSFQLRGSPSPLVLPTTTTDGWSVRIN
ncbi:hypothetical protein ACW9KT_19500 [Hymenobacter sp. HD11105]